MIHAGNSSQISDGSGALLFMSAEKAKSLGLKPLARVHTAVLAGADLRGLDLSGCRFREASLVRTDLRKAVLAEADLTGARTEGLRLEEADLRGARIDPTGWTTAACRGAKIDVEQALAFAVAHGLLVG